MRKQIVGASLVSLLVALGAGAASAQVDVNLAFNPSTAAPGQQVTLFASIANLSSESVNSNFTVTMSFGDFSLPPLPFMLPLAAGFEKSTEVPFVIPPLPNGGTLTITVTAEAGGSTDTATASLTIASGLATGIPNASSLLGFGTNVGNALTGNGGTVATVPSTMSDVKRRYRN